MGTASNHMIPFFKERSIQYLFSSLVFVLLCVFGYLHATKGIDLTDEGFYLSTDMKKESIEITRNC
jgi:hypothetical protein